jgi:hypothetical protein
MLDDVSTHSPAHSTLPEGQMQLPEVQGRPAGHAMPHALQLLGSIEVSTQRPLQLVAGDWQPSAHLPPVHACPGGHGTLHPPQLSGSEAVSTHVPLQLVRPGAHEQEPSEHTIPGEHATPQDPQLAGSLRTSLQRPAQALS